MGDHPRFGILMGFELEQVVVAFGPVQRDAAMQHQSFAALPDDARQHSAQLRKVAHPGLRHMLYPRLMYRRNDPLQFDIAFAEIARMRGQIEQHEMYLAPCSIVRLRLPDDGDRPRKSPAPGP